MPEKNNTKWIVGIITQILFIIASCSFIGCDEERDEDWGEKGNVRFTWLEGGCWFIQSDEGISHEPINLEQEYKEDGLRIRFEYELEEGYRSYCRTGEVIRITRIEKL